MRAAWYDEQGPAAEVLRVGEPPPGRHRKRRERVDVGRVGQRVWVYGAQSYRPFGTAAQLTVVPAEQAVELPEEVSDEVGACLGIPGITAHRAVFGDGPSPARRCLYTASSAAWARSLHSSRAGAVRRSSQLCGVGATSRRSTRSWPRTWANVTIRLLGSDDFPLAAKREAASALTTAARDGALSIRTAEPLPLDRIAEAHDRVDAGARERVLISLPLGDSR